MRFFSVLLTGTALLASLNPLLHADTITDNFALTSGGKTYTFSLIDGQAPNLVRIFPSFDEYTYYSVPVTYDGASHPGAIYITDIAFEITLGSTPANYTQVVDIDEANVQVYGGSATNPTYAAQTVTFPYAQVLVVNPPYYLHEYQVTTGDVLTITKTSDTSPVPEPATLALLGTGLAAGWAALRRQQHLAA